jgi:predicted anti-sigma-YlaC factor YlaD
MGCSNLRESLERFWPDLPCDPEHFRHLRECPECSAAISRHARVTNLLEGFSSGVTPSNELSLRVKMLARDGISRAWSAKRRVALASLLLPLAIMSAVLLRTPDSPKPDSEAALNKPGTVDVGMVKLQGTMVLDRALAAVEPLAQVTASAISRMLLEIAEPIRVMNRS